MSEINFIFRHIQIFNFKKSEVKQPQQQDLFRHGDLTNLEIVCSMFVSGRLVELYIKEYCPSTYQQYHMFTFLFYKKTVNYNICSCNNT